MRPAFCPPAPLASPLLLLLACLIASEDPEVCEKPLESNAVINPVAHLNSTVALRFICSGELAPFCFCSRVLNLMTIFPVVSEDVDE